MATAYQILFCTLPDRATGLDLARRLVEARLAACVNLVPGLTSVYRWQGAIQEDSEHLMLIKTRADRLPAIQALLQAHHPYELPEIVAVPISDGLPAYLQWIDQNLDPSP